MLEDWGLRDWDWRLENQYEAKRVLSQQIPQSAKHSISVLTFLLG
ncbi:MAG TPA: hypothetical protein VLB50_13570 [Ignavibacteriaceae bacterium]|nr:hypothetical protein [Ignavibacteriaceae bacterium]